MQSKENNFSLRVFLTLILTFCFIVLALSGISLYAAPQCRVADEISWRMLGLAKEQWNSLHLTTALITLILIFVHLLVYNWQPIKNYFKPKALKVLGLRPELFFSLLVAAVLVLGSALFWPPFNLLPESHEAIEQYYRDQYEVERPRRGQQQSLLQQFEQSGTLDITYFSQ